jgi:hypothetical protein
MIEKLVYILVITAGIACLYALAWSSGGAIPVNPV